MIMDAHTLTYNPKQNASRWLIASRGIKGLSMSIYCLTLKEFVKLPPVIMPFALFPISSKNAATSVKNH